MFTGSRFWPCRWPHSGCTGRVPVKRYLCGAECLALCGVARALWPSCSVVRSVLVVESREPRRERLGVVMCADMPEVTDREGEAASVQQLGEWLGKVQLIEDTLEAFT